jgi:uncharacterized repeat protein (TIGR01451 family)
VVPPFSTHANDGAAIAAQSSVTALYTFLAPGSCSVPSLMQLSGATFTPGTYCFSSTADLAATGNLTLDGAGTYIFQVGSGLTANVSSTVTLLNGADPCNVFWQVTSAATLNGVNFVGNVVAQAGVTLGVGASLTGRALTTAAGAVALSGTNTVEGCSAAATVTPTNAPTDTSTPTQTVTDTPTNTPTAIAADTSTPTQTATLTPTNTSTQTPTTTPTTTPTNTPTATGSATTTPTRTATNTPSSTPGPPLLQISKTSTSVVVPGATLVYTLSYSNVGGTTATGVVITETVPAHTTFSAAASTPGWSCPNASPSGTVCTLSVPNLAAGGQQSVLFAVRVDNPPGTTVIRNSVLVGAAQGTGGSGNNTVIVGSPSPAPALSSWGLATLLALLAGVGFRRVQIRSGR